MTPTMFVVPWRWTGARRSDHALLFASRFDAKGLRARWLLFRGGLRMRREVLSAPGALGVGLRAHPVRGRFYTLSMWQDEASLLLFARAPKHQGVVGAMRRLGPVQGALVSRDADTARPPSWRYTIEWLASATPGPYRPAGPA